MKTLVLPNRIISTPLPAFIMGIVNATPDSFFERSRGGLERALKLIEEGADILDIGGESTRPGAQYVSAEEELSRIIPVVRAVRKVSDIPISVDTRKKVVMEQAFLEGADILNDVSALEDDKALAEFVALKKVTVILMHKRGIPAIMQNNTQYADAVLDVSDYLESRARYAISCGIEKTRIIVDPGIGFGKDVVANSALIKNCGTLCGGDYPVLIGISRKTCIGDMTGHGVDERLYGTVAANVIAIQNGASIVRVHDVIATADTLKVMNYLQ